MSYCCWAKSPIYYILNIGSQTLAKMYILGYYRAKFGSAVINLKQRSKWLSSSLLACWILGFNFWFCCSCCLLPTNFGITLSPSLASQSSTQLDFGFALLLYSLLLLQKSTCSRSALLGTSCRWKRLANLVLYIAWLEVATRSLYNSLLCAGMIAIAYI